MQGAHTAQQQPRFERPQHPAILEAEIPHPFPVRVLTCGHQRPGQNIAMAIEILGARMHHDICTQGQRVGQHRRGHRGIDPQKRADVMGDTRPPPRYP